MTPTDFKVVGLGGTGQRLLSDLALLIRGHFPNSNLTLIDHDDFEPGNSHRQFFHRLGPKAEVCAESLQQRFPGLIVTPVCERVRQDNVYGLILEGDVVLLCVDNHTARRIVSERFEDLDNAVLISGGNNIDGNLYKGTVQTYLRRHAKDATQPLHSFMHPEIAQAPYQEPEQNRGGCEEAAAEPQLAVVNNFVAATILVVLQAVLANAGVPDIIFLDGRAYTAVPVFRSNAKPESLE